MSLINAAYILLAQAAPLAPWEELPPPPTRPVQRPMSFRDLQQGFQQWNQGEADNTTRDGLLAMVAIVALVALIVHLIQRWRAKQTPDSEASLGRELSRLVPFPFASRLLLWWVARSTNTSFATLLISSSSFQASLATWESRPTFGLVRRWGKVRLERLERVLFEPS